MPDQNPPVEFLELVVRSFESALTPFPADAAGDGA